MDQPAQQPAAQQPAAHPTYGSGQIPSPVSITPALLKQHSITDDEYALILQKLGRTPSLTELGIFSVMWSEHCSYKSSRVHLKRLPTKGTRLTGPGSVVQGPGENAGIIDVGDGWACAFKIESHNHPSYIEPYQGAATGVGGILRDIFTMGARPMAVMDSLRFGPLQPDAPARSPSPLSSRTPASLSSRSEAEGSASSPATEASHPERSPQGAVEGPREIAPATEANPTSTPLDYARNRQTLRGVVGGVGGYGNCFGVPNLGGETRFEDCYSGNPLLNAFALGLVRTDEIFYAKAEGVGNPVFYVGAKTGRDGIHGATMASEEFTEGSEQKRPNVQMGDPFLEKLLLEACLEVMKTGAVLGIQDMGAAGLTCSTCEMGARGHLGVTIELDRVPQRETGMSTYEIMLSESQERMLLVAEKGREQEVLDIFRKWGLDCAEVGTVTADDVMRVFHAGVLEAEIPNPALTDEAPVYHRPVGTWKPPVPKDPPAWVLEELKKPRDYTADLKKLLASPNICSKHWLYEQYDSMVQTNTVQGPGGEAGVIRIKGMGQLDSSSSANTPPLSSRSEAEGSAVSPPLPTTNSQPPTKERGIAMALAGNGRWCYLDPKLGAMHAVAEAARKVACTGATPVAATNCLNFGNPQKPEIMAQLSLAIDGIAEACTALDIPITGGNVSLYNETEGEAIYPTPVIGVVGLLDDVTKAVPISFQQVGDTILSLFPISKPAETPDWKSRHDHWLWRFGSSEYAQSILGSTWGLVPDLHLQDAARINKLLVHLAKSGLIKSAADVGSGGVAVTVAKCGFSNDVGAQIAIITEQPSPDEHATLYLENADSVIVSCASEQTDQITKISREYGVGCSPIGVTIEAKLICDDIGYSDPSLTWSLAELRAVYTNALAHQLSEEVPA